MGYCKVTFEESMLPENELNEALSYVCYERNFYYLFKRYYHFDKIPLLYLDRFIGWKYSNTLEPILPSFNGFGEMVNRLISQSYRIKKVEFRTVVETNLRNSYIICIPILEKHIDGSEYVTTALLEGISVNGYLYFTKISQTYNTICSPITFLELETKLAFNENDIIELLVIKFSSEIEKLKKMNPLEGYQYLFSDLYGYEIKTGGIMKQGKVAEFDLSGFDIYIKHLKSIRSEILGGISTSKYYQSRMHKQISNKIRPCNRFFNYILDTPELEWAVTKENREIGKYLANMLDKELNEMLKYTSLLLQMPNSHIFDLYLTTVERLRNILPSYQELNLDVATAFMANTYHKSISEGL